MRAQTGRCGNRNHPFAFLVVWVFFFNGVLCRDLGARGDSDAPGWGLQGRGRVGGLCMAKPPQCLPVSQAPARRGRGAWAEPREMPINSLRISRSRLSVTLLRRRRGWRDASVCPAVLARLVSALWHWGRSRAEGARGCGAGIGSRTVRGAVMAVFPSQWGL